MLAKIGVRGDHRFVLVLSLALVLATPAQDLGAMLAAAVDRPAPTQREQAARELARAASVSLDDWLAAMRSFGEFDAPVPGTHVLEAALWVGADEPEPTELHVFVPSGYSPARPAPLIAVHHGTGGDGAGPLRLWRAVAEELDMLVVSPSEAGPNDGYAFSERERLAALSAIRWMRRHYNVDENRVHVTGISRGGHLAWDLALRHPHRFASIAPMIGGVRIETGARNNARYLENVVHLPIRDLQGARDDARLVANLRLAFERLSGWNAIDAELIEFAELGHSFDFGAVDWEHFLGTARRDPVPQRVVRRAGRPGEGRAAWVEILATDEEHVAEEIVPEVRASVWNALDDEGRRRHLQGLVDEHTARLEVERGKAPGRFSARGRHVSSFRLLLSADMLPERNGKSARGEIQVRFGGRVHRRPSEPSREVLLLEFVEHFDRTFLPMVEVRVP